MDVLQIVKTEMIDPDENTPNPNILNESKEIFTHAERRRKMKTILNMVRAIDVSIRKPYSIRRSTQQHSMCGSDQNCDWSKRLTTPSYNEDVKPEALECSNANRTQEPQLAIPPPGDVVINNSTDRRKAVEKILSIIQNINYIKKEPTRRGSDPDNIQY